MVVVVGRNARVDSCCCRTSPRLDQSEQESSALGRDRFDPWPILCWRGTVGSAAWKGGGAQHFVTINQNGPFWRALPRAAEDSHLAVAFTLIELLVVISIIAVLASLLLPALAGAKNSAQSTVCRNHLREMGIATRLYVEETGVYPYYSYDASQPPWNAIHWQDSIQPYYPLTWTNLAYHCPAYQGAVSPIILGIAWGSYSYNLWGAANMGQFSTLGLGVDDSVSAWGGMSMISPPHSDAQVVAPGETFAIMDTQETIPPPDMALYASELSWAGSSWTGYDWTGCFDANRSSLNPANNFKSSPRQHGQYFNVAFCDAHVTDVPLSLLFNATNSASNWNVDHQPHPELW